jgi:hypothetical protein
VIIEEPDGSKQRYGVCSAWAQEYNVSHNLIFDFLQGEQNKIAKIPAGNTVQIYPESLVKEKMEKYVSAKQASADGFYYEIQGDHTVRYGSINRLAEWIGIPEPTLNKRLKNQDYVTVRDINGRLYKFYAEPFARSICNDLLSVNLQAARDGILLHEGVRYHTIYRFCKERHLPEAKLKSYCEKERSIPAKDHIGRVRDFYPEPYLLKVASQLPQ